MNNSITKFNEIYINLGILKNNFKPNIIIGIDPGTVIMGYGVIRVTAQSIELLETDVLKLSKYKDVFERLHQIHLKVGAVIETHHPNELAIEAPFFGKNVQSMLKLGRAQGVAIATAMSHGLPVTEYSPKKIKQAITGNGNADKEQVWKMLQHYLSFQVKPKYYDATDALAVALCHHFQNKLVSGKGKKLNGWEDFIRTQPNRIKSK
ncbi:MAG: crossover junction endodeoxyribonuclease RuvC [Bacteroidetes bacterium]|nr:crossover junction endodeoxyribonuclease RuvC [Bacteroidota bacterium]